MTQLDAPLQTRPIFETPPGPPRRRFSTFAAIRRRDVTSYLQSLAEDYGDVVYLQVGGFRAYLFNHPDLIRDVLVTNARDFSKSVALRRAKRLLGEGLLTSEGEFHLQQRRLLQPVFLRKHIAGYAETMSRHAERTAQRWQDGTTIDMTREMARLTLAIVGETLFSADVEAQSGTIGAALDQAVALFDTVNSPLAPLYELLPFGPARRFRQAKERLDAPVAQMIAEHRARSQGEDETDKSLDLLSLLLNARYDDGSTMSDEQVRDEAMTIFLAGHETTANNMAWTWYLLAQHPAVEARLHAELDAVLNGHTPTYEDVEKLTYTRQVIAESMRLYPPAWILGREALRDYPIEHGGKHYLVPQGAIVLSSQWILHHDARYWEEPQRFAPERWAEGQGAERPRFAYFPFGAGPRQCIGENFAWMESILLLATLAQSWRTRLTQQTPVGVRPGITLRPRESLSMRLEYRRSKVPFTVQT